LVARMRNMPKTMIRKSDSFKKPSSTPASIIRL
jgi:hypothetical protein